MIVETGNKGMPLREIIRLLGNKSYSFIECRCKWHDGKTDYDEFFGACKYEDGILTPLDGDTYSLDYVYSEWKEDIDTNTGKASLILWEYGEALPNEALKGE